MDGKNRTTCCELEHSLFRMVYSVLDVRIVPMLAEDLNEHILKGENAEEGNCTVSALT